MLVIACNVNGVWSDSRQMSIMMCARHSAFPKQAGLVGFVAFFLLELFNQPVKTEENLATSRHRLATSVCDFTKLREIRNQFRSKVRPSGGTSKLNDTVVVVLRAVVHCAVSFNNRKKA